MRLFFYIFFSFTSIFASAIHINQSDRYNITSETFYYLDKESLLTKEEVQHQAFKKTNKSKLLLGYQFKATLWIKFSLVNSSSKSLEKIIEYNYPTLKEFTLFDLTTEEEFKGGFLQAYHYRNSFNQPVTITLEANSTREFLIKAKSTDTGLKAQLIVWSPEAYGLNEAHQQHILFLFFGAMVALFFYNLSILIFTKESAYFYYTMVIASFTILELFLSGYINFIFPSYELQGWHLYLLLDIMFYSVMMFSITYLNLKEKIPTLYKGSFLLFVFIIIISLLSLYEVLPTSAHRLSLIIAFIIVIFIGFYALYKKIAQAKYYIFGWLLLLIFVTIEGFSQLGYVRLFEEYPNLSKLSIFLEALMFSVALSARIRLLEQEKERISLKLFKQQEDESRQLELKVAERTQELEVALHDKHLLLQEVHHRVKNNLQIIISLLRLQSDETEDTVLQQILGESENRVKAISNVHELLYQNETLEHIDTQVYFEQLCQDIKSSYRDYRYVDIVVDTKPSLSMDKAIYCGLIANELITNAFKHAFERNEGEIQVILREDKAQNFTFIISDNGKGISENSRENLGSVLVKTLVKKQLKGSMDVHSNDCTKYTISFKG